MACVRDSDSPSPPPSPQRGNATSNTNYQCLFNPNVSPRLKAMIVAMMSWNELHQLTLKAHDLLSTAHLNRIQLIPDGLYQLFANLLSLEKRFGAMLIRVNQFPDPAHMVFFAKFGERSFHAGESIEALLAVNLTRSTQTRANFRQQLQEVGRALQNYERVIYEATASGNFGRSKVQKVFLPQPFPLEYIPISMEPFSDCTMTRTFSSPVNFGSFTDALYFLRNRRRQLLSSMVTLNECRFQAEFTSLDLRDFHHEVELVESEMSLVTNLQRILTTVRLMDEVSEAPQTTPAENNLNNVASVYRETVELFQPIRGPATTPQGVPPPVYGLFEGSPNNVVTGENRFRNLASIIDDRSVCFNSLSPNNSNPYLNYNNHANVSNDIQPPPSSRMSEPLTHSWMLANDRDMERSRNGNASQGPSRSRWFPTQADHLNLAEHPHPRQSRYFWDLRPSTDYMSLGEEPNVRDGPTRNMGSSSAFTRVPRNMNINNTANNIRPRASSVVDGVDFGSHQNQYHENEFTYEVRDNPQPLFSQGSDRNQIVIQDMMAHLLQLGIVVRTNASVVNRNNSLLTDLVIAVDELTRNVTRIQEDVATMKASMTSHATAGADCYYCYSPHIPTRNRSDENWRNIDSRRGHNERPAMNMLNRTWESSRGSATGLRESASALYREHEIPTHPSRFSFSGALSAAERMVGSGSSTALNNELSETGSNSSNSHMLNNQMPPGNRANNYWDNFKSYSQLNLLSDSKTNIPGLSPSGTMDEQVTNVLHEDVFPTPSPTLRRDSRGDRSSGASAIRSSLSANFVENIATKKRNKTQKKQFPTLTPSSPIHSSSSNSSTTGSLNDLIARNRSSNVESHDLRRLSTSRDIENRAISPIVSQGARNLLESSGGVERPLDAAERRSTSLQAPAMSPPSSLEVDLVSRDEFLQLNSGAGSSASGNGKSDDGGPSSSSSKRELEKLLTDNEEFRAAGDHDQVWHFDLDELNAAAAKPETEDWSWQDEEAAGNEGNGTERKKKPSSREMDGNE